MHSFSPLDWSFASSVLSLASAPPRSIDTSPTTSLSTTHYSRTPPHLLLPRRKPDTANEPLQKRAISHTRSSPTTVLPSHARREQQPIVRNSHTRAHWQPHPRSDIRYIATFSTCALLCFNPRKKVLDELLRHYELRLWQRAKHSDRVLDSSSSILPDFPLRYTRHRHFLT